MADEITPEDEAFLEKLLDSDKIKGKLDAWMTLKLETLKKEQEMKPSEPPAPNTQDNGEGLNDLKSLVTSLSTLDRLTRLLSAPPAGQTDNPDPNLKNQKDISPAKEKPKPGKKGFFR